MQKMSKSAYNSSGAGERPTLGKLSTVKGLARPGKREAKSATAASVSEANGKLARPGANQKVSAPSGRGSIARPGGNQDLSGGPRVNHMATTTDG